VNTTTPGCDRRAFLGGLLTVPFCGPATEWAAWLPRGDDRVLLVLELQGGNDGLNTVIPVDDKHYAAARPKLQAVRSGAHRLADGTALHPSLRRLAARVVAGTGAVVHGVGYAKPDRSHFRSRDIWHVADPTHQKVGAGTTGWLGRAADLLAQNGASLPAAAVGGLEIPLLLKSRTVTVPSLERVEDFQWLGARHGGALGKGDPTRAVIDPEPAGDLLQYVAATARTGARLADDLTAALRRYQPHAEYPDSGLGRELQLAARLAIAGFGTRLLHVGFPGFDTHARQLPTHAGLFDQLDRALDAFLTDVQQSGLHDRVAVLVHSEFGRRVAENASQGTDHGAAAPVFVFGGGLAGGTHGPVPDLQKLDDGDVIATADFRSIYRDVLDWLSVDAQAVLGGEFASVGLRTSR
jgi:uncharacterized protein (DUF1501 family)